MNLPILYNNDADQPVHTCSQFYQFCCSFQNGIAEHTVFETYLAKNPKDRLPLEAACISTALVKIEFAGLINYY